MEEKAFELITTYHQCLNVISWKLLEKIPKPINTLLFQLWVWVFTCLYDIGISRLPPSPQHANVLSMFMKVFVINLCMLTVVDSTQGLK